jgi:YHS domain-containing protein
MVESGFHPWLKALPLLVVCIVLVSWSKRTTINSAGGPLALSSSSVYDVSLPPDYYNTCECTLLINCSIAKHALQGGVDFVQYYTDFRLPDGTYNESETGKVGLSTINSTVGKYITYFLTEDNKALFDAAPDHYLPAWGGYCSWGMSAEICPKYPWTVGCLGPPGVWSYWTIIDGRLYFFYNEEPKQNFLSNSSYYIEMGNLRWAMWFPEDPYSELNTDCYHPKGTASEGYEGVLEQ